VEWGEAHPRPVLAVHAFVVAICLLHGAPILLRVTASDSRS